MRGITTFSNGKLLSEIQSDVLPYAGLEDEKLIKSMKSNLKCVLPENVTIKVIYSGTRLRSE